MYTVTQALALGAPAAELKRAERTRRRRRRWWGGAETCIYSEKRTWAKSTHTQSYTYMHTHMVCVCCSRSSRNGTSRSCRCV